MIRKESMATTILLIRHGQTDWNRTERFRGRADVPLNQTGLLQAEATGRLVAELWQPVAIYSSPLSRTLKTAEAVGKYTKLKVSLQAGLIDIDYGNWQGLTPDEARAKWPELVEAWYTHPQTVRIPQGEKLQEAGERAMKTLADLVNSHPDQTIVLVSHTAIIRLVFLTVMGMELDHFWRIQQEPGAISVLEVKQGEYTLVSWNNTDHLHSVKK